MPCGSLRAGVMAAKVTPLQALRLGLSMDIDAVDPSTQTH